MSKYASSTTVSVEKSQSEVQNILRKYGADRFSTMEDSKNSEAYLMFEYSGLMIQITVPLPIRDDFVKTDTG